MAARISEIFLYKEYIKNPNLTKINLAVGRGGVGGMARVSDFFSR